MYRQNIFLIIYFLAALIALPKYWWLFPAIYDDPQRTSVAWWRLHWPQYCEGFRHTFLIALGIASLLFLMSLDYPPDRMQFTAEETRQYLHHIFLSLLSLASSWGASQIIYWLACFAEPYFRPADLNRFRTRVYLSVFWCARALPFLALVLL